MVFLKNKITLILLINIILSFPLTFAGNTQTHPENTDPSCTENTTLKQDEQRSLTAAFEKRTLEIREKWARTLGIHHDPFKFVFNLTSANELFNQMAVRIYGDREKLSPMGLMNLTLLRMGSKKSNLNQKLVKWILDQCEEDLENFDITRIEQQSDYKALELTLEYLSKFKQKKDIDLDAKPIPEENAIQPKPEPKKEKPKKENSPPEKEPRPRLSEPLDGYNPHTKDTEQNKGGSEEYIVAKVNAKTRFFISQYFGTIGRNLNPVFSKFAHFSPPPSPKPFQHTDKHMLFKTDGSNFMPVWIPDGFYPLQPKDPRAELTIDRFGSYSLKLTGDLPEVYIPLLPRSTEILMAADLERYLAPVGVGKSEWPEIIQTKLFGRLSREDAKSNPMKVSDRIEEVLQYDYLYSVGPRPERDIIAALQAGAFQCDMSSLAMVGIAREYGLPARVVVGKRAKEASGSDRNSYLIEPGDNHAFVQIYFNDRWNTYDPTAKNRDRETKEPEDGSPSKFHDIFDDKPTDSLEALQEAILNPSGKKGDKNPDSKVQKKSENKGDEEEGIEADNQETSPDKIEKASKEKIKKLKKEERAKAEEESSAKDKADERLFPKLPDLKIGSIELLSNTQSDLFQRVLRLTLQIALDPRQPGDQVFDNLQRMHPLIRGYGTEEVKQIYAHALEIHKQTHPPLQQWIQQATYSAEKAPLGVTFQQFHQIHDALEVYTKTLDPGVYKKTSEDLLLKIRQIVRGLFTLNHPNAQEIGIVDDLVKNLSNVEASILEQRYGLTQVGADTATQNVAKLMRADQLNDIRLLAILHPYSDFLLNASPRPDYQPIKTWIRDYSRPVGLDFMPFESFADLDRIFLQQPGKSIEENINEGTAFTLTTRKKVYISSGAGKEDAERITIFLYDTSGSMDGDSGRFQAALISSFAGRALSDISASGYQRHKMLIVPFDDNVGTPVPVRSKADAIEIIQEYEKNLHNTHKGTDIQKALEQAYALIADAQLRLGEPLAAANIILATDGQSNIDVNALQTARSAVDRETPIQTLFLAIRETNPDLALHAAASESRGLGKSFYYEFSLSDITKLLATADKFVENASATFYSTQSGNVIPANLVQQMHRLVSEARIFTETPNSLDRYIPAIKLYEQISILPVHELDEIDRPLGESLRQIRRILFQKTILLYRDRVVKQKIVYDLFQNFKKLTGQDFTQLSKMEMGQLSHLLEEAGGFDLDGYFKNFNLEELKLEEN